MDKRDERWVEGEVFALLAQECMRMAGGSGCGFVVSTVGVDEAVTRR